MTENELVGWHLQLNGHEFEPGVDDDPGVDDGTGKPGMFMGSQRVRHN